MSNVVRLKDARQQEKAPPEDAAAIAAPSAANADTSLSDSQAAQEIPEVVRAPSAPETSTPKTNPLQWLRIGLRFFHGIWVACRAVVNALFVSVRTVGRYLYKHPIHALLNVIFVLILTTILSTGSDLHKQLILSKISNETIDKIIQGSRFTRDFDAEAINSGGIRELLRVGAPTWAQREGVRAILYQARKAGLSIEDQAVLLAIADIESGFNPMARASTTTACGIFQFVKRTGESFSLSANECMDPWLNAKSGVEHYLYNHGRRVQRFVEDLSGSEKVFRTFELSYYLHHDGPDYSVEPSNEVKATILNGTQFLFKAYHALQEEAESQERAPSFSESLSAKVWKVLDDVATFLEEWDIPFAKTLHAESSS